MNLGFNHHDSHGIRVKVKKAGPRKRFAWRQWFLTHHNQPSPQESNGTNGEPRTYHKGGTKIGNSSCHPESTDNQEDEHSYKYADQAADRPDHITTKGNGGTKARTNEQIAAMVEQKQAHASQIETLARMFTQQIETLKAEVAELVLTELSNIQATPSATLSYADIARTPPDSQPSNLTSLSSVNTTLSAMTDTLYCTTDTSRVEEEAKSKAQPGPIRMAIEKEMQTIESYNNWRCAAVIRDSRTASR